jgi:hypothetical protein
VGGADELFGDPSAASDAEQQDAVDVHVANDDEMGAAAAAAADAAVDAAAPLPGPGPPDQLQQDANGDMRPAVNYVYQALDADNREDELLDYEDLDDARVFNTRKDRAWCFMCQFREAPSSMAGHPGLLQLQTIRAENYGHVSRPALAQMIQDHYNKELRPCIQPEEDRKMWYKRTIMDHIEKHSPDRLTDTMNNLHTVRGVMRILKQNIKMCNPEDQNDCKINASNVKLLAEMMKLAQKFSADAEKLSTTHRDRQPL